MAKLFYMIGSAGAGKDSIVRYVRPRLSPEAMILFGHRYITRPDHLGSENYVYLTNQEFAIRKAAGLFLMNWDAKNLQFGVGMEVAHWMDNEYSVLIQGSRHYLPEAAKIMGNALVPILVKIENSVIQERLLSVTKYTSKQIQKIVELNESFTVDHPNLITMENNGPIDVAGERLLSLFHAVALGTSNETELTRQN